MRRVAWIGHEDGIVGYCIVHKLKGVVGAVAVQE